MLAQLGNSLQQLLAGRSQEELGWWSPPRDQYNLTSTFCRRSPLGGSGYLSYGWSGDLLRLCLEEEILPRETTEQALLDCAETEAGILGLIKRLRR